MSILFKNNNVQSATSMWMTLSRQLNSTIDIYYTKICLIFIETRIIWLLNVSICPNILHTILQPNPVHKRHFVSNWRRYHSRSPVYTNYRLLGLMFLHVCLEHVNRSKVEFSHGSSFCHRWVIFSLLWCQAKVFFEYYQHISLLADWSWYSRPGNILEMFISYKHIKHVHNDK